jgi:hypothetical protein
LTPLQLKQIDDYRAAYSPDLKQPEWLRKKVEYKHALKIELFIEQAGQCCICERAMRLVYGGFGGDCATFEHVIPASHGGGFNKENVPLSCGRCNRIRGTKNFYEFKASVLANGISEKGSLKPNYFDLKRKERKNKKRVKRLQDLGQDGVLEDFLCKRLNTALFIFAVECGWRDEPLQKIEKLKTRLEEPVDLWKVFENANMG